MYLRLCGTEAMVRFSNFLLIPSAILMFVDVKFRLHDYKYVESNAQAIEDELEAGNKKAKENIFINKLGGTSKPLKSLDDLLIFLGAVWSFDNLLAFVEYAETEKAYNDQIAGLDTWVTRQEANMLDLYMQKIQRDKDATAGK